MWTDSRSWYTKMFIMQNAAIEMHWLMVNHVSRLKKAEKPKMLVWRTEFGRGVFFWGKLNKPCGYWFCQKWLLIISKRPKKSSEWCYFNLTPPTDHGTILRRSPHLYHVFVYTFVFLYLARHTYIMHLGLHLSLFILHRSLKNKLPRLFSLPFLSTFFMRW